MSQGLIDYYTNLLIIQYKGKPNALAFMHTILAPIFMGQLPSQVQEAFTLGSAQGIQLDVIGKYAGVVRSGRGISGNFITLDDTDFTKLIHLAIVINNSGSSLYTIQLLLNQYFPNQVYVFDYKNMHMSYFLDHSVGSSNLAELFVTEDLLPRPMGVELASIIYAPDINHFFSMRSYALPIFHGEPMNNYLSYQTTWPWLSYKDSLQL